MRKEKLHFQNLSFVSMKNNLPKKRKDEYVVFDVSEYLQYSEVFLNKYLNIDGQKYAVLTFYEAKNIKYSIIKKYETIMS